MRVEKSPFMLQAVFFFFFFPGEISPFFDKEIEKVLEIFIVVM
jgi:hypothetical protein